MEGLIPCESGENSVAKLLYSLIFHTDKEVVQFVVCIVIDEQRGLAQHEVQEIIWD